MEYTIGDFIGNIGVSILVGTYFLLITDKIKSNSTLYCGLNLLAALFVSVSLYFTFNLSSVIIECFWITISLYGIWKNSRNPL